MSEEASDIVEQLKTKVSQLESETAALSGENDRLNSVVKTKDQTIQDLEATQK